MHKSRIEGLWHHRDFMYFWTGQTVSVFGDQIYYVALPLTAALTLDATAGQLGVVNAASRVPWLLIGLFAGVWVDRIRRRPVLIAADVVRGLLLLTIPITWARDLLRIEQLYGVAFLIGTAGIFFDVAYQSYLPSLIRRDQLVDGYAKLSLSATVARVSGPGIAGIVVQVLTAPLDIFLDALSFLFSALSIQRINLRESCDQADQTQRSYRSEIAGQVPKFL